MHKNWAARLHYGIRLELEGSMKSWAVPNWPNVTRRPAIPASSRTAHNPGFLPNAIVVFAE